MSAHDQVKSTCTQTKTKAYTEQTFVFQFQEEDLVEEEYVQEGDVEEEEVPDLDQGEPMDDDDEELDGKGSRKKVDIYQA